MNNIVLSYFLWFETFSFVILFIWCCYSLHKHYRYYPSKLVTANIIIIIISLIHTILNTDYIINNRAFDTNIDSAWSVLNILTASIIGYYKSMTEASLVKIKHIYYNLTKKTK